jgi:DNA-directed RNA polymerase subunit beta
MPFVTRPKKYFSKYKQPLSPLPNLLENQLESFDWLVREGLKEVFKEFSPINDYSGKKFELSFSSFTLGEPKFTETYAKANKLTYDAQLKARVKLVNKVIGETKEQEIFLSDLPIMTAHGTFIINGVERVMVPQLARSFGIFFTEEEIKGKKYFGAKIIPARGVWIELETDVDNIIYVRVDKKRKFSIISLLRAMGLATNEAIEKAFAGNEYLSQIKMAIEKDTARDVKESYIEIYKRLRDGDLATADNAKDFITAIFSNERYDLSPVGRFRFNKRFNLSLDKTELERRTLSVVDVITVITHIYDLNTKPNLKADDIDHLGQRRVRFVGELMQQKMRVGMTQIKRNIQDRMSTMDTMTTMPINVINQRPLAGSY